MKETTKALLEILGAVAFFFVVVPFLAFIAIPHVIIELVKLIKDLFL